MMLKHNILYFYPKFVWTASRFQCRNVTSMDEFPLYASVTISALSVSSLVSHLSLAITLKLFCFFAVFIDTTSSISHYNAMVWWCCVTGISEYGCLFILYHSSCANTSTWSYQHLDHCSCVSTWSIVDMQYLVHCRRVSTWSIADMLVFGPLLTCQYLVHFSCVSTWPIVVVLVHGPLQYILF